MMAKKLFAEEDDATVDVSKIEIDEEFARRYEHNKQREELQMYEELKKRGEIGDSDSESESASSDGEDDDGADVAGEKKDVEFFENLLKVRNRDPCLYDNVNLFNSDSGSGSKSQENDKNMEEKKKARPLYLKDVAAKHLIEEGPEFDDSETKRHKTYSEEQEELRNAILDAANNAEDDDDDDGNFLKVKEKRSGIDEEDGGDGGEFEEKLDQYFCRDGELDDKQMFLKDFFMNKMWIDRGKRDKKSVIADDEVDEVIRDEEELERQEEYEEKYQFRHEENAGDRVMGHTRKVEGSVRKKENARKEQRKRREERMEAEEMERKAELKRLKNLKKKEMKKKMKEVMEAAGIKDDEAFPLDLDDLEDEFDPEEYDKIMKKAFDEKYYGDDDADPEFGSDNNEDGSDIEKPDFDKEDEVLGLSKGKIANEDTVLAARERKQKAENGDKYDDKVEDKQEEEEEEQEEEEEGGAEEKGVNGEEAGELRKWQRKRKMSLLKKAREEMLEEYYKLDYEGTVGDLKTRFKYARVDPNRYGLKSEEILLVDEKELNQYVSIKKLAPYSEEEWKVPNNKRHQFKMRVKELFRGKPDNQRAGKKNKSKKEDKSNASLGSDQEEKPEMEKPESRKAKRRRLNKLSKNRRDAYGITQHKAKGKGKQQF